MILKILEALTVRYHHTNHLTDEEHRKLLRRRDRVRDFWLFLLSLLWLVLALNLNSTNNNVNKGRAFAVRAVCASVSAIASEGHNVILHSNVVGTPQFVINLEKLGYRPLSPLDAKKAADAYVTGIADFIVGEVGHKGYKLIRKDGTFDCKEFQRFSGINLNK